MRRRHAALLEVARIVFVDYGQRTVLGVTLMAAQAFCYNAIFFTYALILTRFYDVAGRHIGWFMLPFALGNFMGPLLLGRLFDTHRPQADDHGDLRAFGRADGGDRSSLPRRRARRRRADRVLDGHLLLRLGRRRAPPISRSANASRWRSARSPSRIFYALGTALGGIAGPLLFGALIDTGARARSCGAICWVGP